METESSSCENKEKNKFKLTLHKVGNNYQTANKRYYPFPNQKFNVRLIVEPVTSHRHIVQLIIMVIFNCVIKQTVFYKLSLFDGNRISQKVISHQRIKVSQRKAVTKRFERVLTKKHCKFDKLIVMLEIETLGGIKLATTTSVQGEHHSDRVTSSNRTESSTNRMEGSVNAIQVATGIINIAGNVAQEIHQNRAALQARLWKFFKVVSKIKDFLELLYLIFGIVMATYVRQSNSTMDSTILSLSPKNATKDGYVMSPLKIIEEWPPTESMLDNEDIQILFHDGYADGSQRIYAFYSNGTIAKYLKPLPNSENFLPIMDRSDIRENATFFIKADKQSPSHEWDIIVVDIDKVLADKAAFIWALGLEFVKLIEEMHFMYKFQALAVDSK